MSLPNPLRGLAEIKGALTADPRGKLIAVEPDVPGANDAAAALAVAVNGLSKAGEAAKLGRLATVLVKGARSSTVTAIRPDALLLVTVDPATTTSQVERALGEWAPAPGPGKAAGTPPPRPVPAAPTPRPRAPTFTPPARPVDDPWAALRKALARGQLNEAVAYQGLLEPAADPERPGSEPVEGGECDRAVRALMQGIGSTLAGDGVGGARLLEPLAAATQPNLTFRWLALLWSSRAALRSGAVPTARARIQEALATARQLDIHARAVSQWIAAEVLAQDSDPARALAWLGESRSRFERIDDGWGMGQTWLSEARVLTSVKREHEASEAARQAAALVPDSEEPAVALARLALIRDDLAAAEALLQPLRSQAAQRVRVLVSAIKEAVVTRQDAGEFLREQEAPPSERALRSLERIANASPRFVPARESFAWMLLRLGRYDDASTVFRGLLSRPLTPSDRASVMLGLGCIANAQGAGAAAAAPLREVVAAGAGAPPAPRPAADELPPLPPLSTSAMLARAPQGAAAGSVFSGQLGSFALPDLLEFLRSGKRTGLLVCSSASGLGALRFRDGWITGAASPSTPSLGDLLVRARKIPAEVLRTTLSSLGGDQADSIVGERLVRDGHADAASVRGALEKQIGHAIRELMAWTDGEFTFNRESEEGDAPESGPLAVSLDPQGLLLNFFKEMDEASRGDAASP
jgi:tetratricopeptide (TPR) repeat protein